MTAKFTFYCGTDNTQGVDARQLAYDLAVDFFPRGHSVREETGRWLGENGPIEETTVVVTWLSDDPEAPRTAYSFAGTYKDMAWQESVIVTQEQVDGDFV